MFAWEYEALRWHQRTGAPEGECQRIIMLRWLKKGDAHPVAHVMKDGIAPHPDVLKFLAGMICPEYTPLVERANGEVSSFQYKHRFKVERISKSKGRFLKGESTPLKDAWDLYLSDRVQEKMRSCPNRDDAINEVAEELAHRDITHSRVKTAADRCGVGGKRKQPYGSPRTTAK